MENKLIAVIIKKANKEKRIVKIGRPIIIYPAPQGVCFEKEIISKKKKYKTKTIHSNYRPIEIIFILLLIFIFIKLFTFHQFVFHKSFQLTAIDHTPSLHQ